MDDIHGSDLAMHNAGKAETIFQNLSLSEHPRSVGFDYSRYEHLLADINISEADKLEVTKALWSIITSFVQMGFGVHPVQQAMDAKAACGKPKMSKDAESPDLIDLEQDQKEDA